MVEGIKRDMWALHIRGKGTHIFLLNLLAIALHLLENKSLLRQNLMKIRGYLQINPDENIIYE